MVLRHSQYIHARKLQTIQTASLRSATSCTRTPPTTHSHACVVGSSWEGPSSQGLSRGERNTILFLSRYLSPFTLHADRETHSHTYMHKTQATVCICTYTTLSSSTWLLHTNTHAYNTYKQVYWLSPQLFAEVESLFTRAERAALVRDSLGHVTFSPSYTYRIWLIEGDQCTMFGNALESLLHVLIQCPTIQNTRQTCNLHALKYLWSQPASASAELLLLLLLLLLASPSNIFLECRSN